MIYVSFQIEQKFHQEMKGLLKDDAPKHKMKSGSGEDQISERVNKHKKRMEKILHQISIKLKQEEDKDEGGMWIFFMDEDKTS